MLLERRDRLKLYIQKATVPNFYFPCARSRFGGNRSSDIYLILAVMDQRAGGGAAVCRSRAYGLRLVRSARREHSVLGPLRLASRFMTPENRGSRPDRCPCGLQKAAKSRISRMRAPWSWHAHGTRSEHVPYFRQSSAKSRIIFGDAARNVKGHARYGFAYKRPTSILPNLRSLWLHRRV